MTSASKAWKEYAGEAESRLEDQVPGGKGGQTFILKPNCTGKPWIIAKLLDSKHYAREKFFYERIAPLLSPNTSSLMIGQMDANAGHHWIFLEYIIGMQLEQNNQIHKILISKFLARLHSLDIKSINDPPSAKTLYIDKLAATPSATAIDKLHLLKTINNKFQECARDQINTALSHASIVRENWAEIVASLYISEQTFIHGDIHGGNIMIIPNSQGGELIAIDWGTCGIGPPGIDLRSITFKPVEIDYNVYCAETLKGWPFCDVLSMQSLSMVSDILGLMGSIRWDCDYLLSSWPEKGLANLRVYNEWLDKVLPQKPWELLVLREPLAG